MRGQNSISAMTVLLTLCLGSLGADPWPIQGCPGPQCVVNSLAELAANNQFHNAIDIPTPLGATVLAIQPGYFYPDWRSTAYGSCQVAFYPEGTPQENTTYMHTEALPDPYDWEAGHEVAIQDPICRVKAHDAYHHLHLGTDRGGVSRSNPLKALQPAATFTPPVIKPLTPTHNAPLLLVRDGRSLSGAFTYGQVGGGEQGFIVTEECDVLAWVESVSTGNVPAGATGFESNAPCLPYCASLSIARLQDGGSVEVLSKTLFRLDQCPDTYTGASTEKAPLLFETAASIPYKKMVAVLTNCDGSGDYQNMENVGPSGDDDPHDYCWDVNAVTPAGDWQFPNGIYQVTATVTDTANQSVSASVLALIDHSMVKALSQLPAPPPE